MSELEDLAGELRALGREGNSTQQLVAAIISEIEQLGGSLAGLGHLRHLGGLSDALDALSAARAKAAQAAGQLQSLQSGADAFADSLVGGGGAGGAGTAAALGGIALSGAALAAAAAGGREAQRPSTPLPARTTRTLADIRDQLAAFNPNHPSPFEPANEYSVNCGNVSANVFDYLNGADPKAAGVGTLSDPEMDARTGLTTTVVDSPDDIIARLKEAGPGSHAVVGILRESGSGHWFNVYYDGTDVYTIDGQPRGGRITGFPPGYETDVYSWDVSLGEGSGA